MRIPSLLAFGVAFLMAGCVNSPAPDGQPDGPSDPGPTDVEGPGGQAAPWWREGEWWFLRLSQHGQPPVDYQLVHYENDSASHHFWVGVADRDLALDHALFDTNPFLGRMHWEILAPHESGAHAHMFQFPLEQDKRWQGFLFSNDWRFTSTLEQERWMVEAVGSDGHTMVFDYDPETRWFGELTRRDPNGNVVLRGTVEGHGFDAKGTYWFLRGRDFYRGPEQPEEVHDESFFVDEEVDTLAIHADLSTESLTRIEIKDPSGQIVKERTLLTGGSWQETTEVPGPIPEGEWTVSYILTGPVSGDLFAIGIVESSGTV